MTGNGGSDDKPGRAPYAPGGLAATQSSPRHDGWLAEYLERTGRHPVLVFGTVMAGKSMLLVSLIYALQRSSSVHVSIGEWVLEEEFPEEADMRGWAHFFGRHVQSYAEGEVAPATRVAMPVFIPIDIQPRGGGRPIRLALLEGMGEWYESRRQSRGSMFQELRHELADIMRNYSKGMSVIWVAPSTTLGDGDQADTRSSDLGLLGVIDQYRKSRTAIAEDIHLFLLTKWDVVESPLSDTSAFDVADSETVQRALQRRYPHSWPQYRSLPLQSQGRRYFMQYSAGHMVGNNVYEPPERLRAAFDRYPQTVLNWICGNASQIEAEADGRHERVILFPGAPPPAIPQGSLFKRIVQFSGDPAFYRGLAWGVFGTALIFLAIILVGFGN